MVFIPSCYLIMVFSFWRYLNFCPDFFCHVGKHLITKLRRLISKFITSSAEMQISTIHILPNILRNKGNHTMKFGQWIECNIRDIFLENKYKSRKKSHTLSEKSKLSVSLDQQSDILYSLTMMLTIYFYFI